MRFIRIIRVGTVGAPEVRPALIICEARDHRHVPQDLTRPDVSESSAGTYVYPLHVQRQYQYPLTFSTRVSLPNLSPTFIRNPPMLQEALR